MYVVPCPSPFPFSLSLPLSPSSSLFLSLCLPCSSAVRLCVGVSLVLVCGCVWCVRFAPCVGLVPVCLWLRLSFFSLSAPLSCLSSCLVLCQLMLGTTSSASRVWLDGLASTWRCTDQGGPMHAFKFFLSTVFQAPKLVTTKTLLKHDYRCQGIIERISKKAHEKVDYVLHVT